MRNEIALMGLLVPGLLLCAVIASLLWFLLDALMLRLAGWRLFWHPPLARLALYLVLLAAVTALYPDF